MAVAERIRNSLSHQRFNTCRVGRLVVLGLCLCRPHSCQAETFSERFTGPNPSWQLKQSEQGSRIMTHRRSPAHGKEGVGEFLRVETDRPDQKIRVEHPLPKARVLNEVEVKLWVKADRPGIRTYLRVVLPDCEDPASGQPLAMLIPGDVLEEAGQWQQLACRTDDKLVEERLVLLRAKVKRPLTPKSMIVDRVILYWPVSRGVNELSLDELTFGPIIPPDVEQVSLADHEEDQPAAPHVQFRLDRLEVEGRPFFPVIVPYHEEPLQRLAEAGFNVVWVPRYDDRALLSSIRRAGLWATATPPVPLSGEGDETFPTGDSGLLPFSSETQAIAFWMLGTRIPPQTQVRLVNWVDQIQQADRRFRRPLAADVSGEEKIFSRELDMLGISRHCVGSSVTLHEYRDWLRERQSWARPGSFCWTWIQAAPSPPVSAVLEHHQVPQLLEPEQIRLQVYAALAGGVRGIGFWTPRPLSEESPAEQETLEALRQINWELRLLEPWLATTKGVLSIPVSPVWEKPPPQKRPGSRPKMANTDEAKKERDARKRAEEAERLARERFERELTAAVLRTDYGILLLPMWFDDFSQFVPGPMAAEKIAIVVPGVDETAAAWEITTTGIHNLERERVSGGVKITLKNFDQTACILLTADHELVHQARQRVAAIQERSARSSLTLAELKLERVRDVDQRLGDLGLRLPDGPQQLGAARQHFLEAQKALSQQDWPRVRRESRKAMQVARALQRAHWEGAVRTLPSPVSSPLAVSFQSLPEQARFALQLANDRSEGTKNLLPGGSFEDVHTLTASGWKHEQDAPESVQALAELAPSPHRGKYSLRLAATSTAGTAAGREFVRYISPPVTVHAGHAVRIGGWIKIPASLPSTSDGVLIYDSLMGRSLALRYRETGEWERFELVREVWESQEVTVTLALTGTGEVFLDDLELTVHPLSEILPASAREPSRRLRSADGPRRWPDWLKLNPLPRAP
jgi:hypothetical protein